MSLGSAALSTSLVFGTHAHHSLVQGAWLSVTRPVYPGLRRTSVLDLNWQVGLQNQHRLCQLLLTSALMEPRVCQVGVQTKQTRPCPGLSLLQSQPSAEYLEQGLS